MKMGLIFVLPSYEDGLVLHFNQTALFSKEEIGGKVREKAFRKSSKN